jgi:hypothetical protein
MGRQVLYWWPDDACWRGTVAHLCPRVDSLLDSASYCSRRVLPFPAPVTCVTAGPGPQARRPRPQLSVQVRSVIRHSPGPPGRTRWLRSRAQSEVENKDLMSAEAPDTTVEADGRAESAAVLKLDD